MALQRNDWPILEYDDAQEALLMPNRSEGYAFPRDAVLFFHAEAVEQLVQMHPHTVIGEFENITKVTRVYRLNWKGRELCLCAAPLGSAAAAQLLDWLIACGCRNLLAGGSCGALKALPEGAFLVPERALRDEGASYHYLPPARWAKPDAQAVQALCGTLQAQGLPYARCATWTTDGFFRETKALVEARRAEGCAAVEMECAALAACAQFRKVRFGQLLYTADSLAGLSHEERGWGADAVEQALALVLDAAASLAAD